MHVARRLISGVCRSGFPAALFVCSLIVLSRNDSVFAQYKFDVWNTDNGLPQNTVQTIRQTRDGYLWLATSDGAGAL